MECTLLENFSRGYVAEYILALAYSLYNVASNANYSKIILSPFPISLNLTSSNSSTPQPLPPYPPVSSLRASLSASSTVHTFLFKNQLINPPPFLTSSWVATQYFALNILCARTPFFAPRFNCCAAEILTSCNPCKNASVFNSGSAFAIGLSAACGMPWGVYIIASAASPFVDEKLSSRPSPFMESDERCLRGVVERKGCVAKVMSSAEW